jgi:hypothetical protein
VLAQVLARVVLALADLVAVVRVPRAGLLDDPVVDAELDDLAFARDALAVQDVEQRLAERRRDLVLDDLDARLVADDLLALLDRADAADVEAHRRVELERVAAGRGLRVAEHHADLHADLVDEDHEHVRALDVGRELAQRLAHQPRLQPRQLVAHLALDLGLRHQRRDRVDDDHVDAARAHQHVGDLEALLAGVGLRDQQVADVDAQLAGVDRVERVLGVDVRGDAARLLHLRDDLQAQRRLARRLGTVDLDDAPARQAADAERDVEPERAGRDDRQVVRDLRLAHLHDRALAELLLDLRQRGGERLALLVVHDFHSVGPVVHDDLPVGPGEKGPSGRRPALFRGLPDGVSPSVAGIIP